jgi:hypothetical protein
MSVDVRIVQPRGGWQNPKRAGRPATTAVSPRPCRSKVEGRWPGTAGPWSRTVRRTATAAGIRSYRGVDPFVTPRAHSSIRRWRCTDTKRKHSQHRQSRVRRPLRSRSGILGHLGSNATAARSSGPYSKPPSADFRTATGWRPSTRALKAARDPVTPCRPRRTALNGGERVEVRVRRVIRPDRVIGTAWPHNGTRFSARPGCRGVFLAYARGRAARALCDQAQ